MLTKELVFPGLVKQGQRGHNVRRIQEWLCLNNEAVAIDGDFGPATKAGLKAFQHRVGLADSGILTSATFAALVKPMTRAIEAPSSLPKDLGAAVVRVAKLHLKQHPREVGGQNCGPWVRMYMDGNEGYPWPWCAGFVSFIIRQTSVGLNRSVPLPKTYSCDVMAQNAKARGLFLPEKKANKDTLKPGSIFLKRRVANDWTHTGIVTRAFSDYYETIEGNTNDEGSREGYEVCARRRGYKKSDFVIIG